MSHMLIGDRAASEPRGPNLRSPDQESRFAPQRLIHRPRHGSSSGAAGQTASTSRRDSREVHHAFSSACRSTCSPACPSAGSPACRSAVGSAGGLRSGASGAASSATRAPGPAGRSFPTGAVGPAALAARDAAAGPGPSGHAEAHAPAALTGRGEHPASTRTLLPRPARGHGHLVVAVSPRSHPRRGIVPPAAPEP
jgi:hypothetical protein